MTSTQYAANMARIFMAAELAMASVNCGAPIVTRAQAEKVLDEYFALVEPTLLNPSAAAWSHGSEDPRGTGLSLCAPTQLSGSFRAQPAQFPPT
jgi:hypothetical protein